MTNAICRFTDLDQEVCTCKHCKPVETQPKPTAPTEPGIYEGLPDAVYHGDKNSVSNSGLKKFLLPGGPARFWHDLNNGQENAPHFDEGHAAHAEVLGTGLDVVEVRAKDWKTKAAQQAREDAYAAGKVPLLSAGVEMVRGMGAAVRAHPEASRLLSGGRAELSVYATDPQTWVMLRARPDYLAGNIVCDYKTTTDASPEAFAASAAKFRYDLQDAFYRYVLGLVDVEVDRFVFIAQEKKPPYLLSLHEFDAEDIYLADLQCRKAIDIYAACSSTGEWPGYGTGINTMRLPQWARNTDWADA